MTGKFLVIAVLALSVSGCGRVMTERYVMTKDRVDIEPTSTGNAGFISGQGQYQEPARKTRKVYVLELTKTLPEEPARTIREEVTQETRSVEELPLPGEAEPQPGLRRQIVIPPIEDEQGMPGPQTFEQEAALESALRAQEDPGSALPAPAAFGSTEYTVEKDDTLQKISKKFYGSYGKWVQIYEANKDTIKNPNFVKPGTVLVIPSAENQPQP